MSKDIKREMVNNLLKQSELLLEKSVLLGESIKTRAGEDTRLRLERASDCERQEVMEGILKESEEIRKNSAQVLSNVIQILDMSE